MTRQWENNRRNDKSIKKISPLQVGVITPPAGELGYGRVVAATTMAVTQVKKDGYLNGINVT